MSPRFTRFAVSSFGLAIFCLSVDCFLANWNTNIIYLRLIIHLVADCIVHAVIGGWCWFNVWLLQLEEEWSRLKLIQVVICASMATLLDVDHVIEAGSFEAALTLTKRPFLHNTSLILLVATVLYVLVCVIPQLRNNSFTKDFPTMFLVSGLSHHLRDADKRGVLFYPPFGSTPPLPYKLYVFLVVLLPLVIVAFRALLQVSRGEVDLKEAKGSRQTPSYISSA